MSEMLVSIVTPCYNAEQYIARTIQSVLEQTYQNWEMLIVDDCSTDNSAELIRQYCAKYEKIRYYKTDKNFGTPTRARNIGIKNAKGRFIAFLDSDDIWFPTKLERQLTVFSQHQDAAIVFSDYEKFSEENTRSNRIVRAPLKINYKKLLQSNVIGCLTGVYDTELVKEIYFMEIVHEDYVFWLDILREGNYAYNVGEVLALYRVNKKSFSSNKFKAIKRQWITYRNSENLGIYQSVKYLLIYIAQTVVKYLK